MPAARTSRQAIPAYLLVAVGLAVMLAAIPGSGDSLTPAWIWLIVVGVFPMLLAYVADDETAQV